MEIMDVHTGFHEENDEVICGPARSDISLKELMKLLEMVSHENRWLKRKRRMEKNFLIIIKQGECASCV